MHTISIMSACTALLLSGCVDRGTADLDDTAGDLRRSAPQLIQPGNDLLLLAVTDDNFALYQDGQRIYATAITPGAPRTFVADIPGTSIAFPLQVGKVVFLWTTPQRDLPGFGVSPLVLWTAAQGPRLISPQSAVGLVATAASSDSKQIVFTTQVSDDGLRGDLVYARTAAALTPTTLLANIALDFPNGRCRPLAGFGGSGEQSFPIATYCAGTDTTATLSKWVHGVKTDLISNIATPLPFTLESDPRATTFLVNLADAKVATVTEAGRVSVIDNVVAGRREFLSSFGAVAYTTASAGGGFELRVGRRGRPPMTIGPVTRLYSNLYNRGGYYRSRIPSPDTSRALYGSTFDATTGLTDMNLLDLRSQTAVRLEASSRASVGSEIFTSDSQYALWFAIDDPANGTGELFVGNEAGSRALSTSGVAYDVLRADGSKVSYVEDPVFDPAREFLLSTADLLVADAADAATPPRLISAQANLNYFPSNHRQALAFTSEHEAAGPGLYLAGTRP